MSISTRCRTLRHFRRSALLALLSSLTPVTELVAQTLPCSAASSVCEFSQFEFNKSDWSVTLLYFPADVTGALAIMGDPDGAGFPEKSIRIVTVPGYSASEHGAWLTMVARYAKFEPQILGEIGAVEFEQDIVVSPGNSDTPQHIYGLARQGGRTFVAYLGQVHPVRGPQNRPIQRVARRTTQNDFYKLGADGIVNTAIRPDFSKRGTVIYFGVAHMSKLAPGVDSLRLRGPMGRNQGTVTILAGWRVIVEH